MALPGTNEPKVVCQFDCNNWDILRMLNGGTFDSKGQVFSVRFIKGIEFGNKYNNRKTSMYTVQIITNGIDNPVQRKDVVVKKQRVVEKVEKIVHKKPEILEQVKLDTTNNEEELI